MKNVLKTVLALVFVAGVPLTLKAAPQAGEPLTAKEVPQAEASAKTSADHLRLAAYYHSRAHETQGKLTAAEEQVKHYSWLAGSTKFPNPYTSSRSVADQYRATFEKNIKLAADHERMAESLRASSSGPGL